MSSSSGQDDVADSTFVCSCEKWMRPICHGGASYKTPEGKHYCVLHYPSTGKSVAFKEALDEKIEAKDFDFRGVWFPDSVEFFGVTFPGIANFNYATFNAEAHFFFALFSADALFSHATFSAYVSFRKAKFRTVTDFRYAMFRAEANFRYATFGTGANFRHATFKDYVVFAGKEEEPAFCEESSLDLQFARIEQPHRISFHTLKLRPHWFINVDARRFDLTNIDWDWRHIDIRSEIKSIGGGDALSAHRLLTIACRDLADNAEENHRYEEASEFRYMAMDARRLEKWRGFTPLRLGWWYWLASGYGERAWQAFAVLIGVWLVAAALYTQVGFVRWESRVSSEQEAKEARRDVVGQPLPLPRALTYSLGVMTLQKPEPRPATDAAQAAAMLETILGPVQAALLALAIRRKFMR